MVEIEKQRDRRSGVVADGAVCVQSNVLEAIVASKRSISCDSEPAFGHGTSKPEVTILVPAYNEAGCVADTVKSLLSQTKKPYEVIVIDDCSTDATAEVARLAGARVVTPPENTGSKAGAQTYALEFVATPYVMAIDADTILDSRALETIFPAIAGNENVAAACGFVLPRHVRTIWERGRYIEYMFAFTFFKQVQNYFQRPLISSGCFSIYRTKHLRDVGGWSTRTMAEDMDLTWTFYQKGYDVVFVPEAVSYPIEPHNLKFLSAQLRRWSHGFVQNVRLHWRGLLRQRYLRAMIAVGLWDALVASLIYLFVVPPLAVFVSPLILIVYIIDLPAIAVPTLVKGVQRSELLRVLISLPCYFILRFVNSIFMLPIAA